jgi:hypothetical protein
MPRLDTRIRPEVQSILSRLRGGIRTYVFVEGLTLLIVLAAVLFWISFSVDGLWFAMTKYELARWFRLGFDALALGLLAAAAIYWIGLRLFRSMTTKPLALVLERRFPDLNDRLVTSVEVAQSVSGRESDLTVSMLNRTIESASEQARRLRVGDVFETRPVRWAVTGAMAAIISVVGYGAAYPGDFQRWLGAYVNLRDEYWDRETRLELRVIDELNNVPREFDENRRFKHAKGGDLTLEVSVPAEGPDGKKLVVPERVDLQYRPQEGGSTKSIPCVRSGERTFRVSLKVRENLELFVVGNDFKNREPYYIDVVDPPAVERMELICVYPEYTGMNEDRSVSAKIEVLGKQVSIPLETKFRLDIFTNKPLLQARVAWDRYRLQFGWFPRAAEGGKRSSDPKADRDFRAELISRGLPPQQTTLMQSALGLGATPSLTRREFTTPIPEQFAREFFRGGDQPGFRLPFIVSAQKSAKALRQFEQEFPGLGRPFLMTPDAEMRIYLTDEDEISSVNPEQITIHADRDTAPVIEAQRQDIGDAVTRSATIPIVAKILDDHGVAGARMEYRTAPKGRTTTEGQPWRPWELDHPPQKNADGLWPKRFDFGTSIDEKDDDGKTVTRKINYEYFPVPQARVTGDDGKERDLQAGDLLTISVVARDADDLNGPNSRRSVQMFDFRIVTAKELHYILYEKESRLRIDFEKIIGEIEETRKELADRKIQLAELKRLAAEKPAPGKKNDAQRVATLQSAIRLTARRSQAQLRKNHNETQAVENGFRQIRAELINNKLFTESDTRRLDHDIIGELYNADKRRGEAGNKVRGDYELVDIALGGYNTAVDDGRDPESAIDESIGRTDALLRRLNAALKEMKALVKFHEAVQILANIIKDEDELRQAVEKLLRDRTLGIGQP